MNTYYLRLLSALRGTGFPLLADCGLGRDFAPRDLPTEDERIPDAVFESVPDGALFLPVLLGTARSVRSEAGGWFFFDLVCPRHDVGHISSLFEQQVDTLSSVVSVDRVTLIQRRVHEDIISWTSSSDALCGICRSTPASILSHRHSSSDSSIVTSSTLSDTDDMSLAEVYSDVVRDGDLVVIRARLLRRDFRRSNSQRGCSSIRVYSVSTVRVEIIV
ncbi:hypothetical protein DFH06DRAFT_1332483 [Mycena polygramma]|nr:hypothetical protein DFH06DRAFT_1332483 [Mycena polygramma]